MTLVPAVTGAAILLFFALGALFPARSPAVDWKDTGINIATGALLYAVRFGLQLLVAALPTPALIRLELPIWGQALLGFLALDLLRFLVHWADHRVPLLWSFHRVHHSSEHLNSTSGLRMHVVDLLQLTLLPLAIFQILFDTSGWNPWVIPGVLCVGAVFDAFEHANLPFDLKNPVCRAWNLLLNNPAFHAWHHTRDGALKDGNYGQTLTVWDRLFGTMVTEPEPPELLGIAADQALENGVLGLQLLRKRG